MKKLYLGSKDDRKLFGVCAGIAEKYDIDPTVVRILTVALGLLAILVPTVILYLAAWALIPPKPKD